MVYLCNGVLSQKLVKSLTHHVQEHCHGGESTYQARVRVFYSEQIPVTLSALPNKTVDLSFVFVQWIHNELSPLWSKKHTSMVLTCDREIRAFFGRGEFCVFLCILCRFVSGSYWKHHVSSPVMTLSNISALRKKSDEMWSRRCFCSCVKIRGTIFAEIVLFPKSSFTICRTFSLFIFSSSAITLTPNLRSERTKVRTLHICICPLRFWLPTFYVVLHIFSPILEQPVTFKNTRFLHSVFTISHC